MVTGQGMCQEKKCSLGPSHWLSSFRPLAAAALEKVKIVIFVKKEAATLPPPILPFPVSMPSSFFRLLFIFLSPPCRPYSGLARRLVDCRWWAPLSHSFVSVCTTKLQCKLLFPLPNSLWRILTGNQWNFKTTLRRCSPIIQSDSSAASFMAHEFNVETAAKRLKSLMW